MIPEPPVAKQGRVWATRALAALPTVTNMATWVVANARHLAVLEVYLPTLRQEVQAAIAARWNELDPPASPPSEEA